MNDFFLTANESNLNQLQKMHEQYPASSCTAFFYAKMLQELHPEEYQKCKTKLLLYVINRQKFATFSYQPTRDDAQKSPELVQKEETKITLQPENSDISTAPATGTISVTLQATDNDTIATKTVNPLNFPGEEEIIDNLIEKFSNDPPKIQFDPERHDGTINYGKASLVEDPDIISETLAIFYLEQGYPGKAIKIYKKLCLHFPEKSCYFAAQIQEVKNRKNNN